MSAAAPPFVGATLDIPASIRWGRAAHARSRHCWMNAIRAGMLVGKQTDETSDSIMYVEGLAIRLGMAAPHGWLVVAGKILDVTPSYYNHGGADHYIEHRRWTLQEACSRIAAKDRPELPLSGCELDRKAFQAYEEDT